MPNTLLQPRRTPEINIDERTSFLYECDLVDENGDAVTDGRIDTLTLTLFNRADGGIINGRNGADVSLYLDSDGHFAMSFLPADSPIVDDEMPIEAHFAVFEATWAGGGANWDVRVNVRNLQMVP